MKKKRLLSIVILLALLLGSLDLPTLYAASPLTLVYNGKTVSYYGKQIKVVCDGKNVAMSKTPGILMGAAGYAMLPYYEVFVKSSVKASKTYYSSTKALTITYKNNTVKMTVGSRAARYNGAAVKLPVAPVKVTYKKTGVTRILVPGRAVASYLKIPYQWNSAASTITISPHNSPISASPGGDAASGLTSFIYKGKTYRLDKYSVSYNGTALNLNSSPALMLNGYTMVPYYNAFVKNGPKIKKTYSSATKKLTLKSTVSGNNNTLEMTVNSKKAKLNGKSVTLPHAPIYIKFSPKGSNIIYVPAKTVGTLLGFSYSVSSEKKISYLPGLSIKLFGSDYSVYTRTRVTVLARGQKPATAIPGILEENTTLIPAAATFSSKYGLGVTYKYSNSKATMTKGSNTVIVTVNSNRAIVNGTAQTMPVPARSIYLTASKKNYIMVPGEFVTTALGLNYRYASGVSHIDLKNTGSGEDPGSEDPGGDTPSPSPDLFQPTIQLKRPSSVPKGQIVCTDDYENRRLVITVPGDQTGYYSTNKPTLPSGVAFSTSYSSSSNKTSLSFKTSKINGFKVREDDDNILILNGTPTAVYKNVVVVDAGHGGTDSGTTENGYKEKDFTLAIVKAAKTSFDKNSNYKVYYTRLTDTYPSLKQRYDLANEVNADIFVSVHINSATAAATGTETLYNPDRNKKSSAGLTCYNLASYVQKHVQAATGFSNRGLKQRCTRLGNGLAVLNNNNGPATLTEIGFLSNPAEARKMAANLSSYGKAVYDAVVYSASQYPTNR